MRFSFVSAARALAVSTIATAASAAHAEAVTLSGGWVADFSPSMMEAPDRSTVVFTLDGSYKLQGLAAQAQYFGVTCVGMETATKLTDGSTKTKGSGRCEFKDRNGDRLLAAIETAFDGITFRFEGGTGRWRSARGTVVSRETFTTEGERQLKGFGDAKGELIAGAP